VQLIAPLPESNHQRIVKPDTYAHTLKSAAPPRIRNVDSLKKAALGETLKKNIVIKKIKRELHN